MLFYGVTLERAVFGPFSPICDNVSVKFLFFLAASTLLMAEDLPDLDQAERLRWATYSTIGAPNLTGGLFKAGLQTWANDPEEWGPGWEGFGKRYALRLPGIAVSNVMEAEIGTIWGEDPRYHRSDSTSMGGRVWHAVKYAFVAQDRNGALMPAYARYIAVPASNVISNQWRPESQVDTAHTSMRISLGFVSHIASNAFEEFWPDVKRIVFRRK